MVSYPVQRTRKRMKDVRIQSSVFPLPAEYFNDFTSSRNKRGIYTTFNPCIHVNTLTRAHWEYGYPPYYVQTNWSNAEDVASKFSQFMAGPITRLAHVPLPFQENDGFELIPFLADLDGTIAMFTQKFWKQISYGSVNWGILPFISDVKSLGNSLSDAFVGIKDTYKRMANRPVTVRCPVRYTKDFSDHKLHFEGIVKLQGYVTGLGDAPSPGESLAILLDELGLHPDLKTAWDVVPLSFVADYFLPVGDVLESAHPRGWFCPEVTVNGNAAIQGIIKWETGPPYWNAKHVHSYRVYWRSKVIVTVPVRRPQAPEFSSPSPRELFNTAYLARAARENQLRKKRWKTPQLKKR